MPVALHDPELVVVAGPGIIRAGIGLAVENRENQTVAELRIAVVLGDLRRDVLQIGDLGFGEAILAFPLLRTLQRRHGVVRPDALEVGMSVRRPAGGMRRSRPGDGRSAVGGRLGAQRDRGAGQPGRKRESREHETMANGHGTASLSTRTSIEEE